MILKNFWIYKDCKRRFNYYFLTFKVYNFIFVKIFLGNESSRIIRTRNPKEKFFRGVKKIRDRSPSLTLSSKYLQWWKQRNYEEGKAVIVAGRLMSRRIQGKAHLLNFKMLMVECKYILTEMSCVPMTIKCYIMLYIKNY